MPIAYLVLSLLTVYKTLADANGNFTLTLDFFQSRSYSVKYTEDDYPVFKGLNDYIFIQYSINSTNKDLVVHAETCRATPTNRPYDNPQYVFISNGCDNDSTIHHFGQEVGNIQRFSIQAFRFMSQHRFIYVHCDLVVCNRYIRNSKCGRSYLCSHRNRRDVNAVTSQDDASQTYSLSLGPLMFSGESGNDQQNNKQSSPFAKAAMVGSLAGVSCLALVLTGVVAVGVKKYRLLKSTPVAKPQVISMEPGEQRQKNNLEDSFV